jgi:predicted MFS family arabinose efflux permease
MALIGISIGASFILSLLVGPVLNSWIGVPGIFWLTAVLAGLGIVVLLALVPTPVRARRKVGEQSLSAQFRTVLSRAELLRLDFGIFVLHCVLTAIFVVVPLSLVHQAGFPVERHWQVYLPVMLLGIAIMVPFLLLSDRRNALRPVFIGAVVVLGISQAVFYTGSGNLWWLSAGLVLFFAAFNLLEATLPSLISKTAPVDSKGTAIGVYNSFEFLGAFVGGALGGYLYGKYGATGVFLSAFALIFIWVLVAWGITEPEHHDTHTLRFSTGSPEETEALAARLEAVEGVSEVVLVAEEGLAYIKANAQLLNWAELEAILPPEQATQ